MKKLVYFSHGLVFSAIAPLTLYLASPEIRIYEAPSKLIPAIIFSLCFYLVLTVIAAVSIRKMEAAGLVVSLAVLGFLYAGPLFALVMVSLAIGGILLWLYFKRLALLHLHFIFGFYSLLLAGYYLFGLTSFMASLPFISNQDLVNPVINQTTSPLAVQNQPDIYYIILDSYGRADMLQTIYGYDDSAFINGLEQRGFILPQFSRSNYPRTVSSLSSTLNMQYLDQAHQVMGSSDLVWPMANVLQQSQVRIFLEQHGYRFIAYATHYDPTDIRDGDLYQKPYALMPDNFEGYFESQTSLNLFIPLMHRFMYYPTANAYRKSVLYDLENLPQVAGLPGPKFIFMHVYSPHPPFLFNANGPIDYAPNPPDPTSAYRIGYMGQVEFLGPQVLKMVDALLMHSASKPIIIIQGDHGPGMYLDQESAANTCLYERYSILNAYYFPGVDPASLSADISPVDTFRFIFNHYFGSNFELLPSRQYFSPDSHRYIYQEVTSQSQAVCTIPSPGKP